MGRELGLDAVVEHFTLVGDEVTWLRNKTGATRLGLGSRLKLAEPEPEPAPGSPEAFAGPRADHDRFMGRRGCTLGSGTSA
ncbi:hypothetical protein [Streptomyces sp. HC307]|uniref:hypothetical protein n=1 Tax=Streptomyces flavusporus TaxID=3385496 RepID=UPI0039171776